MKLALFLILICVPVICGAARGPSDPLPLGWKAFPDNSIWYTDKTSAVVSSTNAVWMTIINGHTGHNMHPDFGTTFGDGSYNGIPYNLVAATDTPKITPNLTSFAGESDPIPAGGIPMPSDLIAEQDPTADPAGDRHLLEVLQSSGVIFEMFGSSRTGSGNWDAKQFTEWFSTSNAMRTDTWTSSDASGAAMVPGLVRWDEIQAGVINHMIRITLSLTYHHIWPASHDATSGGSLNPPLGLIVRMKANVDCSHLSTPSQIICTAGKKYGFFLADNGGDWFFSGAPSPNWDVDQITTDFNTLGPVSGVLEALNMDTWQVSANSYAAAAPPIPPPPVTVPRGFAGHATFGGHFLAH